MPARRAGLEGDRRDGDKRRLGEAQLRTPWEITNLSGGAIALVGGQTGVGVVVETRSEGFAVGDRVFVRRPGFGLGDQPKSATRQH